MWKGERDEKSNLETCIKVPEGLVAERHDVAMALLLRISDVHRWSGNAVCTPFFTGSDHLS